MIMDAGKFYNLLEIQVSWRHRKIHGINKFDSKGVRTWGANSVKMVLIPGQEQVMKRNVLA